MSIHVRDSGSYELIETMSGTTVLGFNGTDWFAWIEREEGGVLVFSDDSQNRQRMIDQGDFILVDFENESEYRDMPHLFLGHPGMYEEFILPNGLPDQSDPEKKIIATKITIGKEELERYLGASEAGRRVDTSDSEQDLPIDGYESLSVDEIAERLVALAPEEVEKLRQYEETHQDRKSLRHMFNRHLEGTQ